MYILKKIIAIILLLAIFAGVIALVVFSVNSDDGADIDEPQTDITQPSDPDDDEEIPEIVIEPSTPSEDAGEIETPPETTIATTFSLGDVILSEDGECFTFNAKDEKLYAVGGGLANGEVTVSINPDIKEDLDAIINLVQVSEFQIDGFFCMDSIFSTAFYIFNNNYPRFLSVALTSYNSGVPLFVITFSDSDVTFGILVEGVDKLFSS